MKIVLIQNRSSGQGNRHAIAQSLAARLVECGHTLNVLEAGPNLTREFLTPSLGKADLCIIAGGDGTVHHSLAALAEARVPMYHFPLGTENLFSRHFGMDHDVDRLVAAVERDRVEQVDLASCNGRLFSLMCSVGFDASVVRRVAANRKGGVHRLDYARHAISELMDPKTPLLTIRVDGKPIVEKRSGLVVVANSRQYAARLDPARHASMTDGLLDVVFMPHTSSFGLVRWLLAVRGGVHLDLPDIVSVQCRNVELTIEGASPHQLDGEAIPLESTPSHGRSLNIEVLPLVLRVLLPIAQ